MPGVSRIFGFVPCSNARVISQEKPRSITMDAEIVLGFDDNQTLQVTTALINHFMSSDENNSSDGLYYISGKLACMGDDIATGEGFDNIQYDFAIDCDVVSMKPWFCIYFALTNFTSQLYPLPDEVSLTPFRPIVVVTGVVCLFFLLHLNSSYVFFRQVQRNRNVIFCLISNSITALRSFVSLGTFAIFLRVMAASWRKIYSHVKALILILWELFRGHRLLRLEVTHSTAFPSMSLKSLFYLPILCQAL